MPALLPDSHEAIQPLREQEPMQVVRQEVPDSAIDPALRDLPAPEPRPLPCPPQPQHSPLPDLDSDPSFDPTLESRSSVITKRARRAASTTRPDYATGELTASDDGEDDDGEDEFKLSELEEEEEDVDDGFEDDYGSDSHVARSRSNSHSVGPRAIDSREQQPKQLVKKKRTRWDPKNPRPIPKQRKRLMEIGAIPGPKSGYPNLGAKGMGQAGLRTTEEIHRTRSCEECIWTSGAPVDYVQPYPPVLAQLPGTTSTSSISSRPNPYPPRRFSLSRPTSDLDSHALSNPPPLAPPPNAAQTDGNASSNSNSTTTQKTTYIRFPSHTYNSHMLEMNRLTKLSQVLTKRWCTREEVLARKERREMRRCPSLIDIPPIGALLAGGPSAGTSQATKEQRRDTAARADGVTGDRDVEYARRDEEGGENFGSSGTGQGNGDSRDFRRGEGTRRIDREEQAQNLTEGEQPAQPVDTGYMQAPGITGDSDVDHSNAGQDQAAASNLDPTKRGTAATWEDAAILLTLSRPQSYSASPQDTVSRPLPNVEPIPESQEPRTAVEETIQPESASIDPTLISGLMVNTGPRRPSSRATSSMDPPPIPTAGQRSNSLGSKKRRAPPGTLSRPRRQFVGDDHSLLQPQEFPPGYRPVTTPDSYGRDKQGQQLPAYFPDPFGLPAHPPRQSQQPSSGSHYRRRRLSDTHSAHQRYDPYSRQQSFASFDQLQPPGASSFEPPTTIYRPEPPVPMRPPPPPPSRPTTVNPMDFLTTKSSKSNSTSAKKRSTPSTTVPSTSKRRTEPMIIVPPSPPVFFPVIPAPSLTEQERSKLENDRKIAIFKRDQRDDREKRRKWHEARHMNVIKGKPRSDKRAKGALASSTSVAKKRKLDPVSGAGGRRSSGAAQHPKSVAAQAAETWATLNAVNERQEVEKARERERQRRRKDKDRERNRLPPIVMPSEVVEPYRSISDHLDPTSFRGTQDPMLGGGPFTAATEHGDQLPFAAGGSRFLENQQAFPSGRRLSQWSYLSPLSTSPSNSTPFASTTLASLATPTSATRDDSLPSLSSVFDPVLSTSVANAPAFDEPSVPRFSLNSPSNSIGAILHDDFNHSGGGDGSFDQRFEPTVERDTFIDRRVMDGAGPNQVEWDPFEPQIERREVGTGMGGPDDVEFTLGGGEEFSWGGTEDARREEAIEGNTPRTETPSSRTAVEAEEREESRVERDPQDAFNAALAALEHVRDS
ncbi:hypothetical protein JCM16303_001268 [Sporobolomyces ruberrimus]